MRGWHLSDVEGENEVDAIVEHDKALPRAMTDVLKDDTQLFE